MYVIDTSIWIRIGRHHPPDIFIGLWQQIDQAIFDGIICSPEEVLHELEKGSDGLASELSKRNGLFLPLDQPTQKAVQDVLCVCPSLADHEGERNRADPFVVATAKLLSGTVVTGERARNGPTGRHRIPDACNQVGVLSIDWFGFLREVQWQL